MLLNLRRTGSALRLAALLGLLLPAAPGAVGASAQPLPGGVRVVFAFAGRPDGDAEIELTPDSVRFRSPDLAEGRLLGGRGLTPTERDSAQDLMALASRWSGYRRYACPGEAARGAAGDGYAFSLWSDSLLLACDNCFSCNGGVSLPDAKVLARLGKMTLWLYRMREDWRPE